MRSVWEALRARPQLAFEALSTGWAFRARGGILPSRPLLQWRVATAYGSDTQPIESEDLIRFLEWRRAVRRSM